MITQKIDFESCLRACDRWNKMPKNDPNIYTTVEKTYAGFVAEEVIHKMMPNLVPSTGSDVYHYDFLFGTLKIEVKNKCGKELPKPDFDGSVPTYWVPRCDIFLHTRMCSQERWHVFPRGFTVEDKIAKEDFKKIAETFMEKYTTLFLCGTIRNEKFWKVKKLEERGTELNGHGQKAIMDTWNVKYWQCTPPQKLLKVYEERYETTIR